MKIGISTMSETLGSIEFIMRVRNSRADRKTCDKL